MRSDHASIPFQNIPAKNSHKSVSTRKQSISYIDTETRLIIAFSKLSSHDYQCGLYGQYGLYDHRHYRSHQAITKPIQDNTDPNE